MCCSGGWRPMSRSRCRAGRRGRRRRAPRPPCPRSSAVAPDQAAVPYAGPRMATAPDRLAPPPHVTPGLNDAAGVLIGVTGANHVTEAPLRAPNVNPYDPGSPQAILVGGDADPGGRDIVSGTVAGSVSAAHAWLGELQGDTYGQGSRIGDLMGLPPRTAGGESDGGGFYDPPRDYGGQWWRTPCSRWARLARMARSPRVGPRRA